MLVVSAESYRRYAHMKVIKKRKQIVKKGIRKQHPDLEGAAPGSGRGVTWIRMRWRSSDGSGGYIDGDHPPEVVRRLTTTFVGDRSWSTPSEYDGGSGREAGGGASGGERFAAHPARRDLMGSRLATTRDLGRRCWRRLGIWDEAGKRR